MPLNLYKGMYEQIIKLLVTLQAGNKENDVLGMLSGDLNFTVILGCDSSMTEIDNLSCIEFWTLDHRLMSITPYDL